MKKISILASVLALSLFALDVNAHGGQYRGPGDIVPPGAGRGAPGTPGPTTPGPGGPTTPGPGVGPQTPGPTQRPGMPGGGRGPVTPGMGGVDLDNFEGWQFWWEFNKDQFIRLKSKIHTFEVESGSEDFFLGATKGSVNILKPSEGDIQFKILPALKKAMDLTSQRDIQTACMVAMAKLGKNHAEFKLRDVFVKNLKSKDQEVRETAALALGIAGLNEKETVDILISLVTDSPEGRKLCDRSEVDDRTRSFSIYSLGLLANYNIQDEALRSLVMKTFIKMLAEHEISSRNMKIAIINAMGLLRKPEIKKESK